jgi:enamine deaminase RidA (YjgF/YER057c/UK114 family)
MNIRQQHLIKPVGATLLMVSVAFLDGCGGGGGGGGSSASSTSMVSIAGTAATGKALANATVSIDCAQGAMSVAADANGNYHATLGAVTPCMIAATSGGTTLHSVAFAGGTYNVTPETDLLLSYLAAQLGTNESGLIAGFALNTQFQQVLANQTDVLTAQVAVVQSLQQTYHVTLSTPNFLTTSFVVGQPGEDSDLEALLGLGVIYANGEPDAAAVTLMATVGAAHPIATSPNNSTSGTGGTGVGGTGNAGGMM